MTPIAAARPVYWIAFWFLALSFLVARMAAGRLPVAVTDLLTTIGGYWLAIFVYALQLLVLVDLVRLLNRWIGFIPTRLIPDVNLIKWTGTGVVVVLIALLLYGTWRARTPVVVEYDVAIPKAAGTYRKLNVVLFSDTHLGSIIGNSRIRQLVSQVNSLKPDLVLVAGDIIDDDFRPFVAHDMAAELRKLQSRLGVYGILGNHDAGSQNLPVFRAEMERAGIHLLVDETVKIDNSFYLAGRSDAGHSRSAHTAPLSKVLQSVDHALPILLMDHQPNRLADAVASGVDLQVSGHTHRGQVFPGSLITKRVFEVDWGYLKKEATQFVVSLGYGTWGPPIRIGNRPEVVQIHLTFGK